MYPLRCARGLSGALSCPHFGWIYLFVLTAAIALCLQSPLAVSVIDDKLKEKMVAEFVHIRKQAVEPLASFLDFIT